MGLVFASLVVGFLVHILWSDVRLSDRTRAKLRHALFAVLVLLLVPAAIGWAIPYFGDHLRAWGTIAARMLFGVAIGYASAQFLVKAEGSAHVTTAAALGVATILLVVSSIYRIEDIADRLSGIDTPVLKVELAAVAPKSDGGESRVNFLNTSMPAADAAVSAAQAIPILVDRSEKFALLARYLAPGQIVEEYPDNETRAFVRGLAMPFSWCLAVIHAAIPGDEKRFILTDDFVEYILEVYRSSLQNTLTGYATEESLDMHILYKQINIMMKKYDNYLYEGRIHADRSPQEYICATFNEYMKQLVSFMRNSNMNSNSDSIDIPQSNTFHFPFIVASLLASRDLPGEAAGELLAWLNTRRDMNSTLLHPRSASEIFDAIMALYVSRWVSIYAKQAQDSSAISLGERGVIDMLEHLVEANDSLFDLMASSRRPPDSEPWSLDGQCGIDLRIRSMQDPPNSGATKQETESAAIDAAKALFSFYLVDVNNYLYYSWVNHREMKSEERRSFSDKYVKYLDSFDYDCLSSKDAEIIRYLMLSISETYIVVKLSLISEMSHEQADRTKREVCSLARNHESWSNVLAKASDRIKPYPTILERHTALSVSQQLSMVAERQERLETINLMYDRLQRIERLVKRLHGRDDVTFRTAYERLCKRF